MRLGIDFGTTRTVVAWCDRGNFPVVSFEGESGDPVEWFPSVLAVGDGGFRAGFEALACAQDPAWTLLSSFKRHLSDPNLGPAATSHVGGRTLRLEDLLTAFFEALQAALRSASNLPVAPGEALEAQVAVPAHAHSVQRFLTLEAFRRAGFRVLGLLNEPSAAAFEYTHRHRDTFTTRREHVVVYDFGGGTFDASLIRMHGRAHDVVATAGLGHLGGDDFDRVLTDMALAATGRTWAQLDPGASQRLLTRCRLAKESLNPNSRRVLVELEEAPERELTLSAADYFDACEPLVDQSLTAMAPILHRAADEPAPDGGALPDIAGIYVVGGASALPSVGRTLRRCFGRRVHRSPYPSAATAIGLAIAADEGAGYTLADCFSRVFGVFREAQEGRRLCFDPLLEPGLPLPQRGEAPRRLVRSYRPVHNIGHFRYIECAALGADGEPSGDITPFAELRFPFDPALRAAGVDLESVPVGRMAQPGPRIEERYTVDADGLVALTLVDLDDGFAQSIQLREPPKASPSPASTRR